MDTLSTDQPLAENRAFVDERQRRYLFISGLHRSGTTLFTRSLATHPSISGFRNTGVTQDEGQFLQSVLPEDSLYGSVGRFGFDVRSHMTEESKWNTPANAARIKTEWHTYWDINRPVFMEKTPSNLLRMRLLQCLFDPSYFIVVTRHPVAAALATAKWTEVGMFAMLTHWVHCYRIARADTPHIKHKLWTSYEEFVADPMRAMTRACAFMELPPTFQPPAVAGNQNRRYFELWNKLYLGDTDRALPKQVHVTSPKTLAAKIKDRLLRELREFSLPLHKRRKNLRNYYEALDAVAYLEAAVAEFGYSLVDLEKFPVNS